MTFLWKTSLSERGNLIFTARDAEETLLRWTAGHLWWICACRTTQLGSAEGWVTGVRWERSTRDKDQQPMAPLKVEQWQVIKCGRGKKMVDCMWTTGWSCVTNCSKLQYRAANLIISYLIINSALRCLHVVSVPLLWCRITCRPRRNCWGFFYLALFQSHLFRKQHLVHTPASLGLLKGPLSLLWPIHYNCLLQIGSHADEGDYYITVRVFCHYYYLFLFSKK